MMQALNHRRQTSPNCKTAYAMNKYAVASSIHVSLGSIVPHLLKFDNSIALVGSKLGTWKLQVYH